MLQVKKALNRLGYYSPDPKIGITDIPDRQIFEAVKKYQKDKGLRVTGIIKPDRDDLTLAVLNNDLAFARDGFYIWRTVQDGKVRPDHAKFDGTVRRWSDSPDPGEDFNCRCWAEPLAEGHFLSSKGIKPDLITHSPNVLRDLTQEEQKKIKEVEDNLVSFKNYGYELSALFLEHYLSGKGGKMIIEPNYFSEISIISQSIQKNRDQFELDFIKKMKKISSPSFFEAIARMKNGDSLELQDYWDSDHQKTQAWVLAEPDVARALGSFKLRSNGLFKIKKRDMIALIEGDVEHTINDIYDFNTDTLADSWAFANEKFLEEKGLAKPFKVEWKKKETLVGYIYFENGVVKSSNFQWTRKDH